MVKKEHLVRTRNFLVRTRNFHVTTMKYLVDTACTEASVLLFSCVEMTYKDIKSLLVSRHHYII